MNVKRGQKLSRRRRRALRAQHARSSFLEQLRKFSPEQIRVSVGKVELRWLPLGSTPEATAEIAESSARGLTLHQRVRRKGSRLVPYQQQAFAEIVQASLPLRELLARPEGQIRVKLTRALVVPLWVPRAVQAGQVYVIPMLPSGERIRWIVAQLLPGGCRLVTHAWAKTGTYMEICLSLHAMTQPSVRLAEVC